MLEKGDGMHRQRPLKTAVCVCQVSLINNGRKTVTAIPQTLRAVTVGL